MCNNAQLSNIDDNDNYSLNEVYELNKYIKAENTFEDYCKGDAKHFSKFFEEVFSLEYDSSPNYNYLRGLLIEAGMEEKTKSVPNKLNDFRAKKKASSQIVTMSKWYLKFIQDMIK